MKDVQTDKMKHIDEILKLLHIPEYHQPNNLH